MILQVFGQDFDREVSSTSAKSLIQAWDVAHKKDG